MIDMEKQRIEQNIRAALLQTFGLNVSILVVHAEQIAGKLYTAQLDVNGRMRLDALVMDYGSYCRVWLDSGAIYSFVIQPALQKFSTEHPWLLGV